MRRHFTLEEISFNEFNIFCEQLGLPVQSSEYSERKGKITPKRYYKIADYVVYDSFEKLITDVRNNGAQQVMCIWFPRERPRGNAWEYTQNSFEDYYKILLDKEKEYNQLVIDISKRQGRGYRDIFRFLKEGRLWVLRNFHIRNRNFALYTFKGLEDNLNSSTIHAISGVYIDN